MTDLQRRIREAYAKTRSYHEMMELVWPRDKYPRAHRSAMGGGPPACCMAFGNAIRKMGGCRDGKNGGHTVWLPPLQNTTP